MACDLQLRKFSYVFSEIFSNIDQENIDLSTELKDLKEKLMDIYCELMDKTTQRYKYVA